MGFLTKNFLFLKMKTLEKIEVGLATRGSLKCKRRVILSQERPEKKSLKDEIWRTAVSS